MTVSAKRPATYADLVALPEHVVGEILEGELIVSPRPAPRENVAASALGATIVPLFQFGDGGPGGWWILDEPELHLREDVVVPDLAGWRRERLPTVPEEAYFTLPPDWVCEVVSLSTNRLDRTRKLPVYARAGVAHLWFVDPGAETLEVYRLDGSHWVVAAALGGEARVKAVPFEAVAIDLARLWVT